MKEEKKKKKKEEANIIEERQARLYSRELWKAEEGKVNYMKGKRESEGGNI